MERLVIFDVDGTLTQSTGVDTRCFLRALSEVLGGAVVDANWTGYPHVTDAAIAAEAIARVRGRVASERELAAVHDRFLALLAGELARDPRACRAVPGAAAVLTALADRPGVALAIATGGWRAAARLKLRTAGLYLDAVPLASSSDAADRETILRLAHARALARAPARFETVVYVGDAVWDVRAARRVGFAFVGIARAERAAELRAEGARWVLADFRDPEAVSRALTDARA